MNRARPIIILAALIAWLVFHCIFRTADKVTISQQSKWVDMFNSSSILHGTSNYTVVK